MESGEENPRRQPVRLTWNTVSPHALASSGMAAQNLVAIPFPHQGSVLLGCCSPSPFIPHPSPFYVADSPACTPLASPGDGRPAPGCPGCPPAPHLPCLLRRQDVCWSAQGSRPGLGHLRWGSPTFPKPLRSRSGPRPMLSVPRTAGTARLCASRGAVGPF